MKINTNIVLTVFISTSLYISSQVHAVHLPQESSQARFFREDYNNLVSKGKWEQAWRHLTSLAGTHRHRLSTEAVIRNNECIQSITSWVRQEKQNLLKKYNPVTKPSSDYIFYKSMLLKANQDLEDYNLWLEDPGTLSIQEDKWTSYPEKSKVNLKKRWLFKMAHFVRGYQRGQEYILPLPIQREFLFKAIGSDFQLVRYYMGLADALYGTTKSIEHALIYWEKAHDYLTHLKLSESENEYLEIMGWNLSGVQLRLNFAYSLLNEAMKQNAILSETDAQKIPLTYVPKNLSIFLDFLQTQTPPAQTYQETNMSYQLPNNMVAIHEPFLSGTKALILAILGNPSDQFFRKNRVPNRSIFALFFDRDSGMFLKKILITTPSAQDPFIKPFVILNKGTDLIIYNPNIILAINSLTLEIQHGALVGKNCAHSKKDPLFNKELESTYEKRLPQIDLMYFSVLASSKLSINPRLKIEAAFYLDAWQEIVKKWLVTLLRSEQPTERVHAFLALRMLQVSPNDKKSLQTFIAELLPFLNPTQMSFQTFLLIEKKIALVGGLFGKFKNIILTLLTLKSKGNKHALNAILNAFFKIYYSKIDNAIPLYLDQGDPNFEIQVKDNMDSFKQISDLEEIALETIMLGKKSNGIVLEIVELMHAATFILKNPEAYLLLIPYNIQRPSQLYIEATDTFILATLDTFFDLNPSLDHIQQLKRFVYKEEIILSILLRALENIRSKEEFLMLVEPPFEVTKKYYVELLEDFKQKYIGLF